MFSSTSSALFLMHPSPPKFYIKNLMIPYSVTFPFIKNWSLTFLSCPSFFSIHAELFHRTLSIKRSQPVWSTIFFWDACYFTSLTKFSEKESPAKLTSSKACTAITVILFSVSVPVLSEQIWVARPIVSADASFRTKLFNFYICALEKLNEIVTASGKPSGIATTIMVIEIIIASKISLTISTTSKWQSLTGRQVKTF